ncbi:hypothetical protein B0H13DRAFT_2574142 [Mycena leptocephala]|nr:hypothetical protein B0H13DRAFT_2574142 [Mycena leptocephala]
MAHSNYDVRGICFGRACLCVSSFSSCSLTLSQVVQDTPQRMRPLLVKALINFPKARAAAKAASVEPANIRPGVGMVFGLLIVIVLTSICQHEFFFRSMITGVLARIALTGALSHRAAHLPRHAPPPPE